MDDDTPNTQAEPAQAAVLVVPTKDWHLRPDGYGHAFVNRIPVKVIDFYREPA